MAMPIIHPKPIAANKTGYQRKPSRRVPAKMKLKLSKRYPVRGYAPEPSKPNEGRKGDNPDYRSGDMRAILVMWVRTISLDRHYTRYLCPLGSRSLRTRLISATKVEHRSQHPPLP